MESYLRAALVSFWVFRSACAMKSPSLLFLASDFIGHTTFKDIWCLLRSLPMVSSLNAFLDARITWDEADSVQAHRLITQLMIVGGRVVGRAFVEAYRQASASSKYAQQAAKNSPTAARNFASSGLTVEEACKILNVKQPQVGRMDLEHVMERYKRLYDANDPKQGGSFYLQSKIVRAKDRIELEVREVEQAAQQAAEARNGWNPRLYKQ